MALAGAQMALDDASSTPRALDPYRMSVITASSSGGNEFGQREIQNLWGKGPIFVGAYQSIAWFYAATTGQISIKYGMKGPCGVRRRRGRRRARGALALAADDPARRRRRRQRRHRGADRPVRAHVPAAEHPPQRGARPGGRLPAVRRARERLRAGRGRRDPPRRGARARASSAARRRSTARSSGTRRRTTPTIRTGAADGRQLARAMSLALERAGIGPDDVDAIFADAAGVPEVGRAEAEAIKAVFGAGGRRPRHGAEVDDRPALRRRRAARRRGGAARDARRRAAADDQPRRARGGLRPRTSSPARSARRSSTRCS